MPVDLNGISKADSPDKESFEVGFRTIEINVSTIGGTAPVRNPRAGGGCVGTGDAGGGTALGVKSCIHKQVVNVAVLTKKSGVAIKACELI